MTIKFEANLVGMHFRPPAKDVVNMLPANAELLARRQPDNPYDQNAIAVLLPGFAKGESNEKLWQQFYDEAKADEENDGGEKLAQLVNPLPLGYVCNGEKTGGKKADLIAPQMDGAGLTEMTCHLTFNEKGGPVMLIEHSFAPNHALEKDLPEDEALEDINDTNPGTHPVAAFKS